MLSDVPQWIRRLEPPCGFVNPFQIGIRGPHLFGTETLCGDWNGDLLLLAQDFAPADEVRCAVQRFGERAAWRHNDGDGRYRAGKDTNPAICRLLSAIGRDIELTGSNALNCGVLYGNASFFLKENGRLKVGIAASQPVFEFVTRKMEHLKIIACLGEAPFNGVMKFLGSDADWKSHRHAQRPVLAGSWLVYGLAHPGYWGGYWRLPAGNKEERFAAMRRDWVRMALALTGQAAKCR